MMPNIVICHGHLPTQALLRLIILGNRLLLQELQVNNQASMIDNIGSEAVNQHVAIGHERFSLFAKGYRNREGEAVLETKPLGTRTIRWAYEYIKSNRARDSTEEFRRMLPSATKLQEKEFKALHFEHATFAGVFLRREAISLAMGSSLMPVDIDDLASMDEACSLKEILCADTNIETALCFVSPSGLGVKWIVRIPEWAEGMTYRKQYDAIRNYIGFTYGIDPDTSGSDVCRTCYLPYDPECYINQKYLNI